MRGLALAAALAALAACGPVVEEEVTATFDPVPGGPAAASGTSDGEIIAQAFQDCAATLPDVRAYRDTLDREGIRLERTVSRGTVYTTPGYGAILLIGTEGGDPYCGFGVKGSGGDEALRLADGLVRRTFGANAARGVADGGDTRGWAGALGGRILGVSVTRDFAVNPYFRGALIVMTVVPPEA